jgi:hypothetical protein
MDSNLNLFFLTVTILVIIAFIIFIWTHKTTEEERKRIRKRNEPKVFHKVEEKKENNLKDNSSDAIIGSFIFLFLFFIYFYKVWTDPKFTLGIVGYLLIIILVIGCFPMISKFFNSEKKYQEDLKELNTSKNTNLQYPQSSFDQFIAGRMSLAKCFWFYNILVGIVITVLSTYFAEVHDQYWLLISPITYYSVVSVSLWNCATLYSNEKLENKEPYGWAIAAKIYVVLNCLTVISQTLLILRIK